MPYSPKVRKALFKAALDMADMTTERWAEEQGQVTVQHLYRVLVGERESPPLVAKVDAFIAKHLPKTALTAA